MNLSSQPVRMALQVLLLVLLVLLAVATRRHVLAAQRQLTADGSIPFTLESALAFRRIQMVYRDGDLPKVDRGIQYPHGVVPHQTDTLGAERFYAQAAKLWPGTLNLAEKIRWLHLAWFALAIPGMFFWVKWMGGGAAGGFWAAAFYAVAISAVARSTGQELSHENNALPLLLWHLAAGAWARNRAGRGAAEKSPRGRPWSDRDRNARQPGLGEPSSYGTSPGSNVPAESGWPAKILAGWLSAILAGLALCLWDLVQFYLMLFMAWHFIAAVRGRLAKAELWCVVVPLMAVLLAAGLRNPYLAAHGFLWSPTIALGWGLLLAGAPAAQRSRLATRIVLAGVPLLLVLALSNRFLPAYGHFASLLWAKLRFLNIRPADPAPLTFDQRILWAPALHSTSWALLWEWFPALLVLTGIAVWGLVRSIVHDRPAGADFSPLLFYLLLSLAAFILFFRFHAWLAVFACGMVGLWAGQAWRAGAGWQRILPVAVLALGGLVEARQTWREPLRWGRPNVYADETEALMRHLRTYAAPEPVLANFGISAGIATYGGCPVVLHPKFEAPEIRERVRAYGEALFKGDEEEFKGWMEAQGATIYVHSMGEFSEIQPGLQMRYMVDALEPVTNAAARLFEQRPEELRHFVPQFANRKFRVFRLKNSTVVVRLAQTFAEQARSALENGELEIALADAAHALRMDAENPDAQEVLRLAGALQDAGFRAEEQGGTIREAPALAPARPW